MKLICIFFIVNFLFLSCKKSEPTKQMEIKKDSAIEQPVEKKEEVVSKSIITKDKVDYKEQTISELLENIDTDLIFPVEKSTGKPLFAILIESEKKIIIDFGNSAGIDVRLCSVDICDDKIIVDVLRIFVGADNSKPDSKRIISRYQAVILKNDIINAIENGVTYIESVTPLFALADFPGSTYDYNRYYVKPETVLHENIEMDSKIIMKLNSKEPVQLIDVVYKGNNSFFVKIGIQEVQGWIPLDKLETAWHMFNKYEMYDNSVWYGLLNDSRVRLRELPNLTSNTIQFLEKNEKIILLSRSETRQQIDDMNAYWYKVELPDGKTGWVYGEYVDVE